MYSYHIVAELRQFRGALAAADRRIHRDAGSAVDERERNQALPACPGMDRFFLAIMVSAVLLLIVASDLLVNGAGLQPPADVAMLPSSTRLVR